MKGQQRGTNWLQIALIAMMMWLGFQLIFPPGERVQIDHRGEYEKALSGYEEAKKKLSTASASEKASVEGDIRHYLQGVTKHAPDVARELRSKSSEAPASERSQLLKEAQEIEFLNALHLKELAERDTNFNYAVQAHNEFYRIYQLDPNTETGKIAHEEMKSTSELATKLVRKSFSPIILAGFDVIDSLVNLFGGASAPGFSYWFAAVVLALIVRALVWPLAVKQILSARRMGLLQPMIKELQQKYQGQDLQMRIMKLYKKYGINPLAGCWPALVQMPFLIWVFYSMNAYRFEFQKGTFLWINPEMAAQYPGIIAPNLGEKDIPFVLLYGISMVVSTLLSVTDPQQQKQARLIGIAMSVMFTGLMLFGITFPSAFVLYWTALNIFTMLQTIYVNRLPIPPLVEVPVDQQKGGGLFGGMLPKDGPSGKPASNGSPKEDRKTGAPVLHRPKSGKQSKRKKR